MTGGTPTRPLVLSSLCLSCPPNSSSAALARMRTASISRNSAAGGTATSKRGSSRSAGAIRSSTSSNAAMSISTSTTRLPAKSSRCPELSGTLAARLPTVPLVTAPRNTPISREPAIRKRLIPADSREAADGALRPNSARARIARCQSLRLHAPRVNLPICCEGYYQHQFRVADRLRSTRRECAVGSQLFLPQPPCLVREHAMRLTDSRRFSLCHFGSRCCRSDG